ncbi:hypothetical protein [Povalibacter sp.]|uniref:hypothetical protein n=1 Tax=Povalibacter sp. TaxID=1962978 RepID=UPI002F3F031D
MSIFDRRQFLGFSAAAHHDAVACRFDAGRVRVEVVNNITAGGGVQTQEPGRLSGRLESNHG